MLPRIAWRTSRQCETCHCWHARVHVRVQRTVHEKNKTSCSNPTSGRLVVAIPLSTRQFCSGPRTLLTENQELPSSDHDKCANMHSFWHRVNTVLTFFATVAGGLCLLTAGTGGVYVNSLLLYDTVESEVILRNVAILCISPMQIWCIGPLRR